MSFVLNLQSTDTPSMLEANAREIGVKLFIMMRTNSREYAEMMSLLDEYIVMQRRSDRLTHQSDTGFGTWEIGL